MAVCSWGLWRWRGELWGITRPILESSGSTRSCFSWVVKGFVTLRHPPLTEVHPPACEAFGSGITTAPRPGLATACSMAADFPGLFDI